MNGFELELSDLKVEFTERLLQGLDARGGARDGLFHFRKIRGGGMAIGGATCNPIDNLLAEIVGYVVDPFEQGRRLPMEAKNLNLAIHTL